MSLNKIFLKENLIMDMNDKLIKRIATDNVREALFGCRPSCFGNMPCDNGKLCDNCNSDYFQKAVEDEYSRLIKRINHK